MGAKTSSYQNITQKNNQVSVNKSFIDSVSETMNKKVSNTILKDAKACSADLNNNQEITIKNFSTTGNFNFTSTQKQTAALTFSCVQASVVRNKATSEIVSLMTNNLDTSASSEALSSLDSKAEQATKVGFGSSGDLNSTQILNQTSNSNSNNETHKNIKNILNNIVENNFSSETVSKCISQVNNNQSINLQEIKVGGNAVIAIDQNQAADVITDCIQKSDIGSDILNAAAAQLDVKIEDDISSKSIQEQKASGVQTTVAEGLPMCGSGLSCILVLGLFAFCATQLQVNKVYIIISCVVVVILAAIALTFYILDKQQKDEDKKKDEKK